MINQADWGNIVNFEFNVPQAKAYTVMPAEMYALIGRGGGKTVGIITPWLLHKMLCMPRSSGALVGRSFSDIENKILRPILNGLEMLGYKEDVHYVYGKKPPQGWKKPYCKVIDYTHVLSFRNGTTMELISLHLKGSANGLSIQWMICDEAKFMNELQLREEVYPILRGNKKQFGNSPWYGAKLFVTDKLSPNIHWLLKKRELVDHDRVNAVIYYQLQLNTLLERLPEEGDAKAAKTKHTIKVIEEVLSELRKGLVYVLEASALDNLERLGQSYFDSLQKSLTPYEYLVAILNQDPTRVENNYYPDRTEQHLYLSDRDDDVDMPLGVVFDYQASLSPLVAFQVNTLVEGYHTLNFLYAEYVKHPLGLKDVINNFCERHISRPCKRVMYFYDHTAVANRNGQSSFCIEVAEHFERNGWDVESIHMGQAPSQDTKYRRIQFYLQNNNMKPYPIRINQDRCAIMVLSMDQTGTKETEKGTKKDKSKEIDKSFPQEQATHFPDCFDQVIWAVLERDLMPVSHGLIGRNGFGS